MGWGLFRSSSHEFGRDPVQQNILGVFRKMAEISVFLCFDKKHLYLGYWSVGWSSTKISKHLKPYLGWGKSCNFTFLHILMTNLVSVYEG